MIQQLKGRSLRSKLVLLIAGLLLPSALLLVVYVLPKFEQRLLDGKKDSTRIATQVAIGIIESYEAEAAAGRLSLTQAQAMAIQAVKRLRYNKVEYLWINDLRPYMVMHPIKPALDGTDIAGMKDPRGKALFVEMVDVCKRAGAGFVNYRWPMPGSDKPVPKISYVELFKPWGWVIGTGVYLDDVQKELNRFRLEVGLTFALILLVSFWAAYLFSGRLSKILCRAVTGIRESSEIVSSTSKGLAETGETFSTTFGEFTSGIEQTASSLEQLTSMVKRNAEDSKQAVQISAVAYKTAKDGKTEIGELLSAMDEIATSAKRIDEIVGLIDDIAFQTNLLALNAAVEAARAGEQGKGFAVVANAVRELSQRSAAAAKQITEQIRESSSRTDRGVSIARKSGGVLEEIVSSTQKVQELVNQIASATTEQSTGIQQISQAMAQLDQGRHQNTASTHEVAKSSEQMAEQAEALSRLVNELSQAISGSYQKR